MKEEFQSKDIQKLLGIKKQRVEYLALKVPIKPEVEEVDRSGMVHKYSFKNVLQFAIAHTMNKYGLGISEVRGVLDTLDIGGRKRWPKDFARDDINVFGDRRDIPKIFLIDKSKKGRKELHEAFREYYKPESLARLWCNITEWEKDDGGRLKGLIFYKDLKLILRLRTYITIVVDLNKIKLDLIKEIENISL